ncbi:MAG: SH3 domain-containing protein [Ruminococcus sp.]|nr:SH3 domain-containing protein [Ruminococcus sp.]
MDNYYQQGGNQPKNNNLVKIMLIIAAAVVLIAVMLVVALVVANRNRQNGTAADVPQAPAATMQPVTETLIRMPDMKGISKEDGIEKLSNFNLKTEIIEVESDKAREGYVFNQVPAKYAELHPGDTVTLYVAKAKPTQPVTQAPTQRVTVQPTQPPAPAPAPAPTNRYLFCIAEDYVSLRTGKGVEYKELTKIPRGDSMLYIETSGNWYYVQYGNLKGYVHGDYVSFDSSAAINHSGSNYPANNSPKTYTNTLRCIADDYVSLRTGPNKSYYELAKIPRGYTMTFINYSTNGWYYVQYGSQKGYVYSDYVEFV